MLRAFLAICAALAITLISAGIPASAQSDQCKKSIGSAFTDRMIPGQCLRNGPYMLVMQYDGNLVLYNGDRSCWASGTDGTDGVYAVFSGDWVFGAPYFRLESPYGNLRHYQGGYTWLHKTGADVSLNDSGEVWVGWQKVFGC